MEYRTQWLFTVGRVPRKTETRHSGITGRTININKRHGNSRNAHG
jgi:hypothetical protein